MVIVRLPYFELSETMPCDGDHNFDTKLFRSSISIFNLARIAVKHSKNIFIESTNNTYRHQSAIFIIIIILSETISKCYIYSIIIIIFKNDVINKDFKILTRQ